MQGVTREAAVQLLLSLEDRISLRLRHDRNEFEHVRNNQLGDQFFIRYMGFDVLFRIILSLDLNEHRQ